MQKENNCPSSLWRHHQNIHQNSIVQCKGSWSFGGDKTTQINSPNPPTNSQREHPEYHLVKNKKID